MPKKNQKKAGKINTKTSKIKPLGDRVLLKPEDDSRETRTSAGLYIPESANPDHETKKATVVAVGQGKFVDGKYLDLEVKVGDKVLYTWGDEISVGGEKFIIASIDNVTAVIG